MTRWRSGRRVSSAETRRVAYRQSKPPDAASRATRHGVRQGDLLSLDYSVMHER